MGTATWWDEATAAQKERVIRFLNREALSPLGSISYPALPNWMQALERHYRHGLPSMSMERERRDLRERHQRSQIVIEWRNGGALPSDIRRCKNKKCGKVFPVPKSRPGKLYHDPKCGRNVRSLKSMNRMNRLNTARDLDRVRVAWETFRGFPDRKERTANWARVTKHFVSYAIRRGELR